jgi:septum formation protein
MTATGIICLASASPRRQELLQQIGINFVVDKCDIDETVLDNELPEQYVVRMASEKAKLVHDRRKKSNKSILPVLGADTAVVINNTILGKPANTGEVFSMLTRLSGNTHEVLTAVSLVLENEKEVRVLNTSRVTFKELDKEEIASYVAAGEANDKAGGYGIQGKAAVFISRLEGSYSAVVGLPLFELSELLKKHTSALNE